LGILDTLGIYSLCLRYEKTWKKLSALASGLTEGIVSAEALFISQITKIKLRLAIRAVHRILLNASLIFLAVSTFYFILEIAGLAANKPNGLWYIVTGAISLSSAVFIGIITRSNLLNVLIDIDQRLKLQDRLSTAYEFLKLKKKNTFVELLINDAAARLVHIKGRQLVPAGFSVRHLLLVFLLLINIILYSGVLGSSPIKAATRESKKIENAAKLLKNYTISRRDNRNVRPSKSRSEYSKKLEQLSDKLNDRSKPVEQRVAALDDSLKEVQGERARLADELAARLVSADIKDLPTQKIPDLANLSSDQLERLKGILDRNLRNPPPDSINQNIESLQELDGIEKLLSRIIDDLNDDRKAADVAAEPIINEGRSSQSRDKPDDSSDVRPGPNSNGQLSARHTDPANRSGNPGSGKSQNNGDDLMEEMELQEGKATSAGRAKAQEVNQPGHELETNPGSAIQDRTASSPAKTYLIHIRALTDIGEARLKEEEVFQTYRLQKEDIPLNYREYIKNYFISIGMNTEENPHEFK